MPFAAQSPVWITVRRDAETELAQSRDALEQPGQGEAKSEFHRGYIAALRWLLATPERHRQDD